MSKSIKKFSNKIKGKKRGDEKVTDSNIIIPIIKYFVVKSER